MTDGTGFNWIIFKVLWNQIRKLSRLENPIDNKSLDFQDPRPRPKYKTIKNINFKKISILWIIDIKVSFQLLRQSWACEHWPRLPYCARPWLLWPPGSSHLLATVAEVKIKHSYKPTLLLTFTMNQIIIGFFRYKYLVFYCLWY